MPTQAERASLTDAAVTITVRSRRPVSPPFVFTAMTNHVFLRVIQVNTTLNLRRYG
jgi:hypothetical protein